MRSGDETVIKLDLWRPVVLSPQLKRRVWGGRRLAPGGGPVGEAWVVHENNLIAGPAWRGMTLGELSAQLGPDLLGTTAVERTGDRFPLLIKLLDAHDWLSVQVHPDDALARELEGPTHYGKTEAWHILEAAPDAEIILDLAEGVDAEAFHSAVQNGTALEAIRRAPVQTGDTCFIPAGTVHALGPGLFLYEVQQASDITYRVYDWDRPLSEGRALHLEQARRSVRPSDNTARCSPMPPASLSGERELAKCEYFRLERLDLHSETIERETGGRSFHAITVVEGRVQVETSGGALELFTHASAVIPAAAGWYRVTSNTSSAALVASVD